MSIYASTFLVIKDLESLLMKAICVQFQQKMVSGGGIEDHGIVTGGDDSL